MELAHGFRIAFGQIIVNGNKMHTIASQGIWIGWQIVKSYMTYNQVSLPEMMATPPIDIFNRSKYKPKK